MTYILKNKDDNILATAKSQKSIEDAKTIYGLDNYTIIQTDEEIISHNGKFFLKADFEKYKEKEEYQKEMAEKKANEIRLEIETLDKQRIRAIAEPSVKDEKTGETWLDYYNNKIKELRQELKQLSIF